MNKLISLEELKKQFSSTHEFYSVRYQLMPRIGTPVADPGQADQDTIFEYLTFDKPGIDNVDFGRPEFYKSAKPWDCFGWLSNWNFRGLFLSEKAASVFAKFNLGQHRFYPFKVIHKEKELDYCYLHIQSDETNHVNFPASTFYYKAEDSDDFEPMVHVIRYKSVDEFKVSGDKLGDRGTYVINAVHAIDIKLNDQFDKTLDIFTFADMQRGTIVSARLKSAIDAQKLTGFDIRPVCIRT